MSNLIIGPGDNKLINPAHDKFLDAPITRREVQGALDHFAEHLDKIYGSIDTQHIVINFLAEEKLNVTKEELHAYVMKKKQELIDLLEKRAAAAEKERARLAGETPVEEAAPVAATEAASEQSN
jgi:hypothetical protein